jgi:hypothetical protein
MADKRFVLQAVKQYCICVSYAHGKVKLSQLCDSYFSLHALDEQAILRMTDSCVSRFASRAVCPVVAGRYDKMASCFNRSMSTALLSSANTCTMRKVFHDSSTLRVATALWCTKGVRRHVVLCLGPQFYEYKVKLTFF